MKRAITIFLTMCSINISAQTLECQLMKDEILSQAKQQRQQQQQLQQQQQQQALAYAQMDNMQRAQMSIFQGGAGLGRALSDLGQPSLEQKVQIYKQRCE